MLQMLYIEMLESGTRNDRGKGYQSEAVIACIVMQTELPDCWTKDTFLANLRIEVANNDFNIDFCAFLIESLQLIIEGIIGVVVFILCQSVCTNQAYVEKPGLNSDGR